MSSVTNGEADTRLRAVGPEDYDRMSIAELCAPVSAAVIPSRMLWTISGQLMSPRKAAHSVRRAVANTRTARKGAGL